MPLSFMPLRYHNLIGPELIYSLKINQIFLAVGDISPSYPLLLSDISRC